MMQNTFAITLLVASLFSMPLAGAELQNVAKQAHAVLDQSRVTGGLIVHVGCGDGHLTAALRGDRRFIIQGLAVDATDVATAREYFRSQGLNGPVSADIFDGQCLPYAENVVNLLVTHSLGEVPMEEVMRVLAPGGTAIINGVKTIKPWPLEIDQWTHFMHGPDNNAVAEDRVVGPPRQLQWVAEPRWSRHHDALASVSAIVSANGRLFSIIDEAPATLIHEPPRWSLVARDAFNGVLLWKRAIPTWEPHLRHFRSGPPQLPRRLVATGDNVFVTMGDGTAVSALDAATGKTIQTYAGTDGAQEIVVADGFLYLVRVESQQAALRSAGVRRGTNDQALDTSEVIAVDTISGKTAWKQQQQSDVLPLSLAVMGGRVVFQDVDAVHCLDGQTGQSLWSTPCPAHLSRGGWATSTLVLHEGMVFASDSQRLVALDAEDGHEVWQCPANEGFYSPGDVFVIDGTVWVWRAPLPEGRRVTWQEVARAADELGCYEGRDPRNGSLRRSVSVANTWTAGHHHRCYRNKATSRFLLTGKRGIELLDLAGTDHSRNNWVRGVCQYGILPCNGLLYAPSHACRCSVEAQLSGFHALAPASKPLIPTDQLPPDSAVRLERGPAYSTVDTPRLGLATDWPTLRYDTARSAATPAKIPAQLSMAWRASIGGRLSQPVVADGRLYVAQVDAHTVHALDAKHGRAVWTFTAGGRVDSPPTVCGNRVVFGAQDGWVYCVCAADGALMWRFFAAPRNRRIVADGHISSVWPVHGSVLVQKSSASWQVYVAAGRSGHLDGGVSVYALDLVTGEVRGHHRLSMPHPRGDEQTDRATAHAMPGVFSDVLVSHDDHIHMRHTLLDLSGGRLEAKRDDALLADSGMLDDSGYFRSHWRRGSVHGQILVFDQHSTYGVRSGYQIQPWLLAAGHQQFERYAKGDFPHGSLVFATSMGADQSGAKPSPEWSFPSRGEKGVHYRWSLRVPLQICAMALTGRGTPGSILFLAGRRDAARSQTTPAAGLLWAVSAENGERLSEVTLLAPPVFDSLVVADESLFLATQNGMIMCLRQ